MTEEQTSRVEETLVESLLWEEKADLAIVPTLPE